MPRLWRDGVCVVTLTDQTQTMVRQATHERRVRRIARAVESRRERGQPVTVRLHGYVSERNARDAVAAGQQPVPQTVTVTVTKAWHAQTERYTVLGLVTEGREIVPKAYNVCKAMRVCIVPTPAEHRAALDT